MTKSLKDHKRAFLDYLGEIRGYSDATLKTYDEALSQMLAYGEIEAIKEGYAINLMPLRLHIAPLKAKTIAKKLSAIRSFATYLKKRGIHVTLRGDESIKVPKTLPKPVPHMHIMEAVAHADLKPKLVVLMLYALGLRISELSSLRLEQISQSWVRVMGKGRKEREVPLLPLVRDLIQEYQERYTPKQFLFESRGDRLSENSLRYMVTKLFKDSALKVTPHQLRHAFATELLAHHARINDVSELLGHASMATTQIYTKLGSVLKMEHYLKAHPLCKDSSETSASH
ncbi:MAG: tyrosine-type recombinase/integrase [Campylobacterales bacterium]|nr:tyrosine-type recombinase/integrase [Campylobacterales bacterium]